MYSTLLGMLCTVSRRDYTDYQCRVGWVSCAAAAAAAAAVVVIAIHVYIIAAIATNSVAADEQRTLYES